MQSHWYVARNGYDSFLKGTFFGLIWLLLRTPSFQPLDIISSALLVISLSIFFLSFSLHKNISYIKSVFPPLVLGLLGIVLFLAGQDYLIILSVLVGGTVGVALGLLGDFKYHDWIVPIIFLLGLFLLPPHLRLIPELIFATLFLGTVLAGILSVFTQYSVSSLHYRWFIYESWAFGWGLLFFSSNTLTNYIDIDLLRGIIGITLSFLILAIGWRLENSNTLTWPWLTEFNARQRFIYIIEGLSNKSRYAKDELYKLVSEDEDRTFIETIMWLVGYSLLFRENIERILNEFTLNFLQREPEVAYLAQQVILDLPLDKDDTLFTFIEATILFDKMKHLPSGSGKFDANFVSNSWPKFVEARRQAIIELASSEDVIKKLNLPFNYDYDSSNAYTVDGIFQKYCENVPKNLRIDWRSKFPYQLLPSKVLKLSPVDPSKIRDFLKWLDEVTNIRDSLLEVIKFREEDARWLHRRKRLGKFGVRELEVFFALVNKLRISGFYFEAGMLAQLATLECSDPTLSSKFLEESFRCNWQYLSSVGQTFHAQLNVELVSEPALDPKKLRITNRTATTRHPKGVTLRVWIFGPKMLSFTLEPSEGKIISIEPGDHQVLVYSQTLGSNPTRISASISQEYSYSFSALIAGNQENLIL